MFKFHKNLARHLQVVRQTWRRRNWSESSFPECLWRSCCRAFQRSRCCRCIPKAWRTWGHCYKTCLRSNSFSTIGSTKAIVNSSIVAIYAFKRVRCLGITQLWVLSLQEFKMSYRTDAPPVYAAGISDALVAARAVPAGQAPTFVRLRAESGGGVAI